MASVLLPATAPPHWVPAELWPLALAELRLQMTKATFHALLADSVLLAEASQDLFLVVVVRNQYAWEWVTFRLQPVISRTLTGIAGYPVQICFIPRLLLLCEESRASRFTPLLR